MEVRKTKAGLALKRWFKEEWKTNSGKRDDSGGENKFRPTKKKKKKTQNTRSKLRKTKKEKKI